MGLLAGKEQRGLGLSITDSGVSMATASGGGRRLSGLCCPWMCGIQSWSPGSPGISVLTPRNKSSPAQIRKGGFCRLQLITVTDTNSDSEITSIVFPVWKKYRNV